MEVTKPTHLFKGEITKLDENLGCFLVKDFVDNVNKIVILSGKQRFEYKSYSIGDIIYAARTIEDKWKLVTGSNFKRSDILIELKTELDNYLSTISPDSV